MLASVTTLLLGTLVLARSGAQERQCSDPTPPTVQAQRYEMALRIDYEAATIGGDAELTVANTGAGPIRVVPFLLYRLMTVESVTDEEDSPLQFSQHVASFADWPQMQVNHVEVQLPAPLPPGQRFTLRIVYDGYLHGYTETGMRYVRDRVDPQFTILRPDAFAYPKVGVPCLAAIRAAPLGEFDYRVSIDVPDSLVVANGGELLARSERGGRAIHTYANTRPAWRMDFAIADYGILKGGDNRVFYLPGDSLGASRVLEAVEASFALFSAWFGPAGEARGLTIIEIPNGWGSQKDVTTIIQTAAAFREPQRMTELYHEVSHFWNVTDLDGPSPRWNEGLASYLEELASEELQGVEAVAPRVEVVVDWLRDMLERRPRLSRVPLIDYGKEQMTDFSYSVGMVFFAVLHELAGEEGFREIVGGFYQRYAAHGATTDQFTDYARRVGPPSVERLVRDWIYSTGWTKVVRGNGTLEEIAASYRRD